MFSKAAIERLVLADGHVRDSDGRRVGRLSAAVAVDAHGQPSWVSVQAGLLGAFRVFVPLKGARIEGTELWVAHTKKRITTAPLVAQDGHLRLEEEQKLRSHYGIDT
jgi:hypothetical protein